MLTVAMNWLFRYCSVDAMTLYYNIALSKFKIYAKIYKKTNRPPKITEHCKKKPHKKASIRQQFSYTFKREMRIPVGTRRVQQILHQTVYIEYIRGIRSHVLTDDQRKVRVVQWAEDKLGWQSSIWKTVVFSDEKKTNLVGTDGVQYYLHHIRNEVERYSERVLRGWSVMVWGAIWFNRKLELIGFRLYDGIRILRGRSKQWSNFNFRWNAWQRLGFSACWSVMVWGNKL